MDDDYSDYDFPPAKYPRREAFTMLLAFTAVAWLVVWFIWRMF